MLTADTRRAAALARRLGRRPKPFQLGMVEALSRPHPADARGYARRVVVVLAPRRVGKTTTILDVTLARMRGRPGYAASYTAQTGHAVTELFGEPGGWLDAVEGSGLPHFRTRRSQGTERITYRPPGRRASFVAAFPPVPGKLRGRARHLVVVDEAQELDDVGAALVADVMPTGDTLGTAAQLVVAGTAGYGPGWWQELVDRARAGELGLVELGTWPPDADPDDERVWAAHHPGLIAGLTTLDALRDARAALGAERFAREYGNRWGTVDAAQRPIPVDLWAARRHPTRTVDGDRPAAVGFDVTLDRAAAAVVAVSTAGRLDVLAPHVPVDDLPGVLRVVARGVPVGAGPAQRALVEALQRSGLPAVALSTTDYRGAAQRFVDRLLAGELWHRGEPPLEAAVEAAGRVWHGDGWVLSARRSGGDVTPLVAAVVAAHVATTSRRPRVVGSAQPAS